jgi:hypothetical protein
MTLAAMRWSRLIGTLFAVGSVCFAVGPAPGYIDLVGSVAFGISAVASFIVPSTGSEIDVAAANWTTAIGAVCFLAGALILRSSHPDDSAAPAVADAQRRVDAAGL